MPRILPKPAIQHETPSAGELQERAIRARMLACSLPDGDDAAKRLLEYAEELEGEAAAKDAEECQADLL